MATSTALDVWLKFEHEDDEEPTYEAYTFREGDRFRIDWYHNSVGQVTSLYRDTYEEARIWYEENGFRDFTV